MNEFAATRRALVVTAIQLEYAEVRRHLAQVREEELPHGLIAEVGEMDSPGGLWRVWVVESGMGNENAALETDRAVAHIRPQVVFFIGIAGGRKDVALGDVVVASKVYGYELGKDEAEFRPRPESPEPSYRLLQRARAVARSDQWFERIGLGPTERTPRVVIKPIAAGEKVVASRVAAVAKLLDRHYGDAVAVEMEGHGFHRAMHARPGVEALVVRGISDLFDDKAAADAAGGQPIAARNAAAFAMEVLARFSVEALSTDNPEVDAEFWDRLWEVASALYPRGPEQGGIWERSGGQISRLRLNEPPKSVWYEAIMQLRQGVGTDLSLRTLLREMQKDWPASEDLAALRGTPGE